jgi:methyl-accepting chemotaxis protein-1 (serine sensor receptor)
MLAAVLLLALIVISANGWRVADNTNEQAAKVIQTASLFESAVNLSRKAQVDFKIQVQEWKNILLRGNDPAAFEKYQKEFSKKSSETQDDLKALKEVFGKLKIDAAQIDDTAKAHQELFAKYSDALKQYDVTNPGSAKLVDGLVKGMDRPPTKKIDDIVASIIEQSKRSYAQSSEERAKAFQGGNVSTLIIVIASLLVCAFLTVVISNSITVPMREAVDIANNVASGNLSTRIEVEGDDETSELLTALKQMNFNLNQIINELKVDADTIASVSIEIANSNMDLSNRTEEQAESLDKTSIAMEELTGTVKHNAEHTREANAMSASTSVVAKKGGEVVGQVINTMNSINDSSKKIVDIIGVIDGIAFQTNILALNAAVEAARAGEQGRGFAVVASEVRSLAQRSASAAKEIKTLISDSVEKVEAGSKLVNQAGITMSEVVDSVARLDVLISEISTANAEQTHGIEQINQAVLQIDHITQQNTALVEESAAAAETMQNQAENLKQVISRFHVSAQEYKRLS